MEAGGAGGGEAAPVDIRPFQESDEAAVIQLWHDCGLVVPWNDPASDIACKLLVGRDLFLIGVDPGAGGAVVASAMGGYEGHRGWVNYLAVHPDYRREGIGRQLMEAVEDALVEAGCPKINIQVRESNREAVGFYRSLGYVVDPVICLGKRLDDDDGGPTGEDGES